MSLSQSFFSKLNSKAQSKPHEKRIKHSCVFHDLIFSSQLYKGIDAYEESKKAAKVEEDTQRYINSRTSFYVCKRIEPGVSFDRLPSLIAKRIAYRKENKIDQWGRTVYNDTDSKNIDHVSTEFQCYQLLKGSHRAVQMIEFLHENTKASQDKKFFYQFLKLNDRRSLGIRNILFVLEEMNEGSLKEQIDRIAAKQQQKLSQETIIEYSCQIAQGLLELRQRGIVHRDLRPQNVLFHNGQIKFSDFDSAFIRGYSDYRNIKNGVNMGDTTPLQIMLLIAESEQRLKRYTSEQLYELQQDADIYFLGVNIYSMVFSHSFESFNGGKVLNNLINMKKRNGFCPKLLDLMARCLEKDSHVRIGLDEAVRLLSEIERETYFKSSKYTRVYLSPEPLDLSTFSTNQLGGHLQAHKIATEFRIDDYEMNKNFAERVRIGTVQRHTERYEIYVRDAISQKENGNVWVESEAEMAIKSEQKKLRALVEKHLQRLQIKAFYYQLAYRILCQVNLDNLIHAENCYLENIQSHLDLLSNQLVVLLTFLYDVIIRCPFTEDPHFVPKNIGYENRRVFENIRLLYSRKSFFAGRKKVVINSFNIEELQRKLKEFKEETGQQYSGEIQQVQQGVRLVIKSIKKVGSLEKLIQQFYDMQYQDPQKRKSFWYQYSNLSKFMEKIQSIVKDQTVQTIINLIIAYEKLKVARRNNFSNLKNAIFMLMILESQTTAKIHKNDMVIIKTELTNMINLRLGWKSEELQAFFNNYTEIHKEQVAQGLHELESQAFLAGVSSHSFDPDEQIDPVYEIKVEEPHEEAQRHDSSKESPMKMPEHKAEEPEKANVSFKVQEEALNDSIIEDSQCPIIKVNRPEDPLRSSTDGLRNSIGGTFDFQIEQQGIINNRSSIEVEQIDF